MGYNVVIRFLSITSEKELDKIREIALSSSDAAVEFEGDSDGDFIQITGHTPEFTLKLYEEGIITEDEVDEINQVDSVNFYVD